MCQSASSFFLHVLFKRNLVMESRRKKRGYLKKHNIDVGELNKWGVYPRCARLCGVLYFLVVIFNVRICPCRCPNSNVGRRDGEYEFHVHRVSGTVLQIGIVFFWGGGVLRELRCNAE